MTTTRLRYAARTHVGKVRRHNEDSILALPDIGVFIVADGMGGHTGGDFASQTVIEALAAIQPDKSGGDLMRAVRAGILGAHATIAAEAEARGGTTIGSTVICLLVSDAHFACLWVGDSRLYLCRDGHVEQLSQDHSLVGELVRSGRLTAAEAERHPQANVITRAVGVGEALEIDKIRGATRPGDRFLLCSDGVSRYLSTDDLATLLVSRSIENVADALIERALDAGGEDNASVIVVEIG
ncbi:MAG TPA: protein phosphatase 2C domain-containing protein [Paracoccaceae bacterium]|nr:protein phosphatase 2C domain-containing protein [Paracoccaceae bacterium]